MICAEQSTMNETDLDSAIFYSNISLPSEKCYEIHKQDNFSSDGCLTFIYKENAEFFFHLFYLFIFFFWLGYLNKIQKINPKRRLEFSISYRIQCPATQIRVHGVGSGIHVLAHLEASSSLIYDCV